MFKKKKDKINQLSKAKAQINKPRRNWAQFWKKISLSSALLGILGGLTAGAVIAGVNLPYTLKSNIDFSGGYQIIAGDYDFKKNGTDLTKNPNGVAKNDWKLLKNKLDPLSNFQYQYKIVNNNAVSVVAPKSLYKNMADFQNAVNRTGDIFLSVKATDPKDKTKTIYNDPAATASVSKTDNVVHWKRTPLRNIFQNSAATSNKQKQPILQLNTGSGWSSISKTVTAKNAVVLVWTDIGTALNQMRSDYENLGNFIPAFNASIAQMDTDYDTAGAKLANQMPNLFGFTCPGQGISQGNVLNEPFTASRLKTIFNDPTFKWKVPANELIVNANEDTTKANVKFPEGENLYAMPFFTAINKNFLFNATTQNEYGKYVLNYDKTSKAAIPVKSLTVSGSNVELSTASESEAIQDNALISQGLKGIVFQVSGAYTIPPKLSNAVVVAAITIAAIFAVLIAVYLILYFRSFGLIMVFTITFAVLMTLYVTSLLSVTFSPISIGAITLTLVVISIGMIFLARRYKLEKIKNKLPLLTAFKIAVKQTLPILIDGVVVFLLLALSFYWLGSGSIKIFATTLLLNILIVSGAVIFVGLFAFFALIKLRVFDKIRWFDIQPWINWSQINIKKLRNKKAKKSKITVNKKIKTHAKTATPKLPVNNEDEDNNPNLWSEKEDSFVITSDQNQVKSAKVVSNKQRWWKRISWYRLIRWTPIAGIIILIAGIVFFFSGVANFDPNIKSGTVFYLTKEIWNPDVKSGTSEINYLKDVAAGKIKVNNPDTGQNTFLPFDFSKYNADFYTGVYNDNNPSTSGKLVQTVFITTNISTTDSSSTSKVTGWLRAVVHRPYLFPANGGSFNNKPVESSQYIGIAFAALGLSTALILVYTIFRFDWAQFIAIVGTGLFVVGLTFGLISILHLLISIDTITILLGVWAFAVVCSAFIMAKARNNKKQFNMDAYDDFFSEWYDHSQNVKGYKKIIHFRRYKYQKLLIWEICEQDPSPEWLAMQQDLKQIWTPEQFEQTWNWRKKRTWYQLMYQKHKNLPKDLVRGRVRKMLKISWDRAAKKHQAAQQEAARKFRNKFGTPESRLAAFQAANPSLSTAAAKNEVAKIWAKNRNFFAQGDALTENPFQKALQAKQDLKTANQKFRIKKRKDSFLDKAAELTVRDMFFHYLILGIFCAIIFILLAIFSGPAASYFLTFLIGSLIALYSSFVIALPIWVYFEQFRSLNRVRVRRYLDRQRVEIDEQSVKGVNS